MSAMRQPQTGACDHKPAFGALAQFHEASPQTHGPPGFTCAAVVSPCVAAIAFLNAASFPRIDST